MSILEAEEKSNKKNLINNDVPYIIEEASHFVYEGFLAERKKLMANKLNSYYGQL
ncbi:hypothetical protein [Flavobacterium sp. XS2P39]|uniref:hypothetical protein n=1 Tax=Flavobacterium sp. XS2P39 TaxID=3401725 RepID=UPI003AAB7527